MEVKHVSRRQDSESADEAHGNLAVGAGFLTHHA